MSLGYIALGISLVSAYQGGEATKKIAKGNEIRDESNRREIKARQRIASIKAQRERKSIIKEARINRGKVEAVEGSGGFSSTSVAGHIASGISTTASSVGASETIQSIGDEQSVFAINASKQAQSLFSSAASNQALAGYASATVSSLSLFKTPKKTP